MNETRKTRTISRSCLFIDNDCFHQAVFTKALADVAPDTICITVPDGTAGLYVMLEKNVIPSYIFIELTLPRMGGLDFLEVIKRNDILKDIPVVVHTQSPQPHVVLKLKELGAHAIYFRRYEYLGVCNMLTLCFGNGMAGILPN
jgi:CheY-like chemotaxis protein